MTNTSLCVYRLFRAFLWFKEIVSWFTCDWHFLIAEKCSSICPLPSPMRALSAVPLWPVLASLYSKEFLPHRSFSWLSYYLHPPVFPSWKPHVPWENCIREREGERERERERNREEGELGMPLSDFHSWTWARFPFPLFLSIRAQHPEISFKMFLSLTEVSLGQLPPQLLMNLGATIMWHT